MAFDLEGTGADEGVAVNEVSELPGEREEAEGLRGWGVGDGGKSGEGGEGLVEIRVYVG